MIKDTISAASDDSAACRLESWDWRMEMLVVTAEAAVNACAQVPITVGDGTETEVLFVQMKEWWCCHQHFSVFESKKGRNPSQHRSRCPEMVRIHINMRPQFHGDDDLGLLANGWDEE